MNTITYKNPSGDVVGNVVFTNDELDRITSMIDSLGTTTYTYDDSYRDGDIYGKLTVTDPNGFAVVYEYDKAHRLMNLVYPGNKKVIYGGSVNFSV